MFLDANRIAYVGKIETFNRIDEDGTELGLAYAENLDARGPTAEQMALVR